MVERLFGIVLVMPLISAFRSYVSPLRVARCSWLGMSDALWTQAIVKNNAKNAEGIRFLEFDVKPELAEAYKIPGQYVQIKLGSEGKPGFYAMACAPGSASFSFIVKETENNVGLTSAKIGSAVEMSSPMGKVFTTCMFQYAK